MFEHPLTTPVSRADFDGDGRTDLSIFRPTDGTWWMNRSVAGIKAQNWGLNGDVPVPGDYDADGKTDVAVWRPNDPNGSTFYVFNSATNTVSYGR
ncbi:MAG: VCBS repeat-containing protein, partial [Pyrinomonadaceae bacterium]